MKTVLFATDHMPPDPEALDYALLLCRRMAARLEVLHILQSSSSAGSGQCRQRKGKIPARHKTISREGMPAGAETGVPDTDRISGIQSVDRLKQWLPDRPTPPVVYHCEVAGGATGTIIERYVRNHGEIVLTVFDPCSDRHPADIRSKAKGEMPKLAIPLVLVKKAR
jgi:hypothetical protein